VEFAHPDRLVDAVVLQVHVARLPLEERRALERVPAHQGQGAFPCRRVVVCRPEIKVEKIECNQGVIRVSSTHIVTIRNGCSLKENDLRHPRTLTATFSCIMPCVRSIIGIVQLTPKYLKFLRRLHKAHGARRIRHVDADGRLWHVCFVLHAPER
jgi:hypothetical protein